MSNLTVFQFEQKEVRFVGTAIDPWWVAADVCAILDIVVSLAVNGRERKAKDGSIYHDGGLDEDEKGLPLSTPLAAIKKCWLEKYQNALQNLTKLQQ